MIVSCTPCTMGLRDFMSPRTETCGSRVGLHVPYRLRYAVLKRIALWCLCFLGASCGLGLTDWLHFQFVNIGSGALALPSSALRSSLSLALPAWLALRLAGGPQGHFCGCRGEHLWGRLRQLEAARRPTMVRLETASFPCSRGLLPITRSGGKESACTIKRWCCQNAEANPFSTSLDRWVARHGGFSRTLMCRRRSTSPPSMTSWSCLTNIFSMMTEWPSRMTSTPTSRSSESLVRPFSTMWRNMMNYIAGWSDTQ